MIININSFMQFRKLDIFNWIISINVTDQFIIDEELEIQHTALTEVLKIYPNIKTYNVIMNPWARARYIFDRLTHSPNVYPYLKYFDMSSFENFVMNWKQTILPHSWRGTATPQAHFIIDSDIEITYLIRAETFTDDFKLIQEAVQNYTPIQGPGYYPEDYQEHYTPAMKDKIAEMFAVDIEIFNYSF